MAADTNTSTTRLTFFVNGKKHEVDHVDPRTTLASYLRNQMHLTGTKIGCNEGGCGACTVMISDQAPESDAIQHYSVNACLMPVCSVNGKAVTTVEGIGSLVRQRLHPIQERLAKAHGSQCGFCTPGFIMAMYALLRNYPQPTEEQIDVALQGNLCRCTGYRPILEAFYSFAKAGIGCCQSNGAMTNGCCQQNGSAENGSCQQNSVKELNGGGCCQQNGEGEAKEGCCKSGERKELTTLVNFTDCSAYDSSQEPIFPPELLIKTEHSSASWSMLDSGISWYQPSSVAELVDLKSRFPEARIVFGNTEVGVEQKFRFLNYPVLINPRQIAELRQTKCDDFGVFVGSGFNLNEMDDLIQKYMEKLPAWKTQVFTQVRHMLHWFAGKHVRNMASVAGNIATGSPISDLNPIWMASGAKVVLLSKTGGEKIKPIDEKFYTGYRKNIIDPTEIIYGLWIPYTTENQHFRAYKQAQRREDDIAIVNAAINVTFKPSTTTVESVRIAYGGMAPTTKLALKTGAALTGLDWNDELLEKATQQLVEEMALSPGVPGGMERFRQTLALSFFAKFFFYVNEKMQNKDTSEFDDIPQRHLSATQTFSDVPADQASTDPVGRPLMHQSGEKHTSGEAVYVDDVRVADCLHLAFVLSTKASAKILSVDTSEALKMDGVECYIDHRDVPGKPLIGHNDTPVFASEQVTFYGQPIGAIIAEDAETARRAANKVKVTYEDLKPLVTIEQAFEAKSFHKFSPLNIHSSLLDSDTVPVVDWSKFDHVVSGSVKIGGQEHFYLETSGCLVIPGEVNDVEVISSTQSVNDVQGEVSSSLGIPRHKVFVRVKRIGGGFGGKESTAGIMACPTAIAAMKLRRPVRCILERFDDMVMTGTRHAFRVDYKVGLDKEGKLLNFEAQLFNNCGHTLDQSKGVMGRAATHIDSVYKWANADFIGHLCKTNLQSATAYRGFGAPQAMYATETIMTHIAEATGLDINELREMNMYKEGDRTPFGMTLTECNIRRCWTECKELSKYDERKITVDEYNSKHKYKKRGIVLTPTKFGIAFSINQLNQAGALVHIYLDGSVLVSHGGMEMGQGLHTKMLQVAARCLEIPIEMVNLHETATDKVPNASPTAASVGSDLNGLAVQDACNKLMARLAPFKKANPTGKWLDWVTKAYVERVSLSATGFGIIHSDPVDYVTGKGAELYSYCVYGVACSEVEIDCMTGDHRLLRTDIVMDVGDSLNPALDIGQIEGAFVQGYGMFTMEELKVAPNGFWITRGPGNYKIPSADDAPREFHVKLLKGSSNKKAIFSSRAVGEPPLFLGASAAFAIREAVKAYRMQHGLNGYFRFDSPATPERIRMACVDQFTDKIPELPNDNSFTPWTVQL